MSMKKYGLIIKKKVQENPVKKSSIFGNDSSEEEEDNSKKGVNVSLMREAEKKKQMKQTQIEIEKALKEDPTVYEYDNIYDDMAKKKEAAIPKLTEKDKKPKYIQNLLKSAKTRKMEEERRIERKTHKEREQEGGEFQEKEEFVTSAYRKRMIELEEEEKQLREKDAIDARNDVTKRSDLSMFYSNLLKHNVSMGGAFSAEAKGQDEEPGEDDKNEHDDERSSSLDKKQKSRDKPTQDTRETKIREEILSKDERRSKQARDDRKERRHDERQRHREESHKSSRRHHERRRNSSEDEEHHGRRDGYKEKDRKRSHRDVDRHTESTRDSHRKHDEERFETEEIRKPDPGETSKQEDEKKEKNKQENVASSKFVKRSNDETISSAKQRYLERKRAREMALQLRKTDDSDED